MGGRGRRFAEACLAYKLATPKRSKLKDSEIASILWGYHICITHTQRIKKMLNISNVFKLDVAKCIWCSPNISENRH